jgi:phosphate transport system protein
MRSTVEERARSLTAMRAEIHEDVQRFRTGLVEMASLVLSQVERGVSAWEHVDAATATAVIEGDDDVDERCVALDAMIFTLQTTEGISVAEQRLLHVGLIATVALERVGDLAVAIAEQARSVRPEGTVPEVQALIGRMSARGIDALANAVQGIARGDVEQGELAAIEARNVGRMLGELLEVVARAPDEPETRAWSAAAVLVGRHLERVANNGAELGGRIRFMTTGEPFVRAGGMDAPG